MIEDSLIRKASNGDADSQYKLGVAITDIAMHAQSREQSLSSMKQATNWLMQAAQQGHADAQYMLGLFFVQAEDFEKAVKFFTQAAENGHSEAQYKLGSCYYSGKESVRICLRQYIGTRKLLLTAT